LPHTTNFSGIIVVAKNNIPVPVISPLKENYIDEVKEISKTLEGIDVIEFGSVSEFVKRINDLVSKKPYSVKAK